MSLEFGGLCPLLQVFDLEISLRFYREALGFEQVEGTPDWVWLKRGEVELMLNTAYEAPERPPEPDPARVAAHGDTILFFGCPDVDAAYQYLVQRGIPVMPPTVAPYGMKQLTFSDPDGYSICLQWPAAQ